MKLSTEQRRVKLYAALAGHADDDGVVRGVTMRQLGRELGWSRDVLRSTLRALRRRGAIQTRTTLGPSLIVLADADRVHADPHIDEPIGESAQITDVTRAESRSVSFRLLARLLMHHGDNPPDAESAKAVAGIRERIAA